MSFGGSSGTVEFVEYIEKLHMAMMMEGDQAGDHTQFETDLVGKGLGSVLAATIGASPYTGIDAFDPATDLDELEEKYSNADSEVSAMVPKADWEEFLAAVEAKKGATFPEDEISNDVHTASTGIVAKSLTSAETAIAAILSDVAVDVGEEFDAAIADAGAAAGQACINAAGDALSALQSTLIKAEVDAYNERTLGPYLQGVNRFTGQMADINAVMGSAFVIGMATMEGDRARDVRVYEAQVRSRTYEVGLNVYATLYNSMLTAHSSTYANLSNQQLGLLQAVFQGHLQAHIQSRLQTYDHKAAFLNKAVTDMAGMLLNKTRLELTSTSLMSEVKRFIVQAKTSQISQDLQIDAEDIQWDLDIHRQAQSLLGAPGSGSAIPKMLTSVLGATASGLSAAGTAAAALL